ncbi:MAG: hypothetical protein EP329_15035 [Deltaproteobacteria bacterium]|nr:MAG: hypothetical protein EP329_15035 [Deltaproteobacteria bacterium]
MSALRIALVLAVTWGGLGMGAACGGKDEPEPVAPADPAVAVAPAEPARAPRPHPETEEALVGAFTDALEARDLDALSKLAAPELAADLRRMHGQDAGAFWSRGQQWIDNVRSGFEIRARQEDKTDHWRALLHFENGNEETVQFSKVEGKLVFLAL